MLGVGSMGGAILTGLRAPEVQIVRPIAVTTKSAASAAKFAGAADVTAAATDDDAAANRRAVAGAGLVVLGVKPWLIVDTAREIADALAPGAIVVSVAAGVSTAAIEAVLPAGVAVVRAMPNTPSHIGLGVTGIAAGATADDAQLELVRRLFETVGSVLVVPEEQINAVGAVSGSGPAHVFLFVEEMIAAAERLGFDAAAARELVRQTVLGSIELMRTTGEDPAQLRRNVTSPNGTTERSVAVLQEGAWGELFDRAFAANIRRSEELQGS
ncbi:pyrroline-5-carboxylate reductase [Leucobacter luti]|uniref:Pyrroline-5-carboxylate reductase n=1 Tax=Leucobacter luti TaxID=340320 RepID=A0A4V6MD29_9MICO|nr:pyrroline-5-carboxylate reductase [Leucobacter luti]MBL3699128.1 pyrroline-5-carboxylate reductase [Leucobacter luti]RZT66629.1 pyrroline-5-carboxylate reductase [Leucobacter luti]